MILHSGTRAHHVPRCAISAEPQRKGVSNLHLLTCLLRAGVLSKPRRDAEDSLLFCHGNLPGPRYAPQTTVTVSLPMIRVPCIGLPVVPFLRHRHFLGIATLVLLLLTLTIARLLKTRQLYWPSMLRFSMASAPLNSRRTTHKLSTSHATDEVSSD